VAYPVQDRPIIPSPWPSSFAEAMADRAATPIDFEKIYRGHPVKSLLEPHKDRIGEQEALGYGGRLERSVVADGSDDLDAVVGGGSGLGEVEVIIAGYTLL